MKKFIIPVLQVAVFYQEDGNDIFLPIEKLTKEEAKGISEMIKKQYLEMWEKSRS